MPHVRSGFPDGVSNLQVNVGRFEEKYMVMVSFWIALSGCYYLFIPIGGALNL